jgi:hypothetical protein
MAEDEVRDFEREIEKILEIVEAELKSISSSKDNPDR